MPTSVENKKLYDLLMAANERFNLTRIRDYDEFLLKHIADSQLGAEFVSGSVLDIGSGAGFPAFVLKLDAPELNITMLDSVQKKVDYLNSVIKEMEIKNARAVHYRIEDFPHKGEFDTVTARAVAPLNVLVEYALPFLKIGGQLVAYKASEIEDEINEAKRAISLLGGKIECIAEKMLNGGIIRKFVIIKKIKATPKQYPRGANKVRQNPL